MRWKPSSEQIALAVDCAVARVPLGSAALLGVSPRTLRVFLKRLQAVRGITGGTSNRTQGNVALENSATCFVADTSKKTGRGESYFSACDEARAAHAKAVKKHGLELKAAADEHP